MFKEIFFLQTITWSNITYMSAVHNTLWTLNSTFPSLAEEWSEGETLSAELNQWVTLMRPWHTLAYTGIPALPCLYAYDIALNTPHFRRRGRGGKTPQNMRTLHSTALTDTGECTSRKLNCRPICTHFQSSYHENLYIPQNVTTYNFLLPRPVVQESRIKCRTKSKSAPGSSEVQPPLK